MRLMLRDGRLTQKEKKHQTIQLAISKAQKGSEVCIIIAEVATRGARGCMASPHSHTKRSEGFNYL